MNQEVINKWKDALTSGEYKQGKGYLKSEVNGETVYCCLGVLADLRAKDTGSSFEDCMHSLMQSCFLSNDVANWAGINYQQPQLADENDNGRSFEFIASNLEKLINP